MKNKKLLQLLLPGFLMMGIFVIFFNFNTLNSTSSIENNISNALKQTHTLELNINQAVLFHQFGLTKNHDTLSQLSSQLISVQNRLNREFKRIDSKDLSPAFKQYNQQIVLKLELIESFKTHYANYSSHLYFFQKTARSIPLNKQEKIDLQSLEAAALQFIYQTELDSLNTLQTFINNQQSAQLSVLIQQLKIVMTDGTKVQQLAAKIATNKPATAREKLNHVVTEYFIAEHQKSRTIQNILFLIMLLYITYITLKNTAKTDE